MENNTNTQLFFKIFKNRYLCKYLLKHTRELRGISDEEKPYSLYRFSYHDWRKVSDLLESNYISLLIDKLYHPIYSQDIQFSSEDALSVCEKVKDFNQFNSIYQLKKEKFYHPSSLQRAVDVGNLEIVKLLMNQTEPITFSRNGILEIAFNNGSTDIVKYMIENKSTTNTLSAYQSVCARGWIKNWSNDTSEGKKLMLEIFGDENQDKCFTRMKDSLNPSWYDIACGEDSSLFFKYKWGENTLYRHEKYHLIELLRQFEKLDTRKRIEMVCTLFFYQNQQYIDTFKSVDSVLDFIHQDIPSKYLEDNSVDDVNEYIYCFIWSKIKLRGFKLEELMAMEFRFSEFLDGASNSYDMPRILRCIHQDIDCLSTKLLDMISTDQVKYMVDNIAVMRYLSCIFKASLALNDDEKATQIAQYILDRYPNYLEYFRSDLTNIGVDCESQQALTFVLSKFPNVKLSNKTILKHPKYLCEYYAQLNPAPYSSGAYLEYYYRDQWKPLKDQIEMFRVAFSHYSKYDYSYYHLLQILAYTEFPEKLEFDGKITFKSAHFYHLKKLASKFARPIKLKFMIESEFERLGSTGSIAAYKMFKECLDENLISISNYYSRYNEKWEDQVIDKAIQYNRSELVDYINTTTRQQLLELETAAV